MNPIYRIKKKFFDKSLEYDKSFLRIKDSIYNYLDSFNH